MASAIIDGTNIDVNCFSYTAPKPNASGGTVINLLNKHFKESLTITVPLMGSWGAKEKLENVGKNADGTAITRGTGKYSMSLQFSQGEYSTPDGDLFLEQMKCLENKIKMDAIVNSRAWFGKDIKSMEVIDEKFTPMLKYPKMSKGSVELNYEKPPTMNVNVPCWKGVWQPSVFDEDYTPLYIKGSSPPDVTPLNFLTNENKYPMQVICLIQCGGLWLVNGKMSITWNLIQCVVRKQKTSSILNNVCMVNIKSSDKQSFASAPEEDVLAVKTDEVVTAYVEDSDDDEMLPPPPVQAPAPAPEPTVVAPEPAPVTAAVVAPEPEKKKKVVKKKE
jgi:hypothetical protein